MKSILATLAVFVLAIAAAAGLPPYTTRGGAIRDVRGRLEASGVR